MDIYITKPDGTCIKTNATEMLPHGFGPECLDFAKIELESNNNKN